MDVVEAKRVVTGQDRAIRALLQARTASRASQCGTIAELIAPWLGKPGTWRWRALERDLRYADPKAETGNVSRYGNTGTTVYVCVRPELRLVLQDACDWLTAGSTEIAQWGILEYLHNTEMEVTGFREIEDLIWRPEGEIFHEIKSLMQPRQRFLSKDLGNMVGKLHFKVSSLAAALSRAEIGDVLQVPSEVSPPRYGRLKDGILESLLREDIVAQVAACRTLAERKGEPSDVRKWTDRTADLLELGLGREVARDFRSITCGAWLFSRVPVPDPGGLSGAYLAFGIEFLEEVQKRMGNYGSAAGQGPAGISISGGTFIGSTFADQVNYIDSTIVGVAASGGDSMAVALRELEKAVLSEQGFDDEQRHDLLDNVADLADEAKARPERRRRGRVKAALDFLAATAPEATEIAKVLDAWGPILHQLAR